MSVASRDIAMLDQRVRELEMDFDRRARQAAEDKIRSDWETAAIQDVWVTEAGDLNVSVSSISAGLCKYQVPHHVVEKVVADLLEGLPDLGEIVAKGLEKRLKGES